MRAKSAEEMITRKLISRANYRIVNELANHFRNCRLVATVGNHLPEMTINGHRRCFSHPRERDGVLVICKSGMAGQFVEH